jgi:predicted acetyltransferase
MSAQVQTTPIDAAAAKNLEAQGLRFELLTASDDSFEPWFQAMVRGFLGPQADAESLPDRREGLAHRRLSGVWDDAAPDAATPVSTASSWVSELTVPGERSIPSWAISTITVAPTHRRRGIAGNLIEAELRTAARLDVAVAILTASEATIYERFGFAPTAMRADWTIDTTQATWIGPIPNGTVHLIPRELGRDSGGHEILERARLHTPGQIFFDGHLWNRLFGLPGGSNPAELRVVRYDDAAGIQQGLAIYRAKENDHGRATVTIEYLTTATDDAYAALWRYLLELDLVGELVAPLRSVDEPLRWQISNARAATENAVGDHLWARILNVKTALEARRYSAAGEYVLEIDDRLGFAGGTYLLAVDPAGQGSVRSLEAGDEFADAHHLEMSVNELAAIYLGGTSVSTLVRAGRISERTPGAAGAADAAFRSEVAPWLSIWF